MKTIHLFLSLIFMAHTIIGFAQSDSTQQQKAEAEIAKYGIPGQNNPPVNSTTDSTTVINQNNNIPSNNTVVSPPVTTIPVTTSTTFPTSSSVGYSDTVGYHYKTKVEIPIYLCDIVGNRLKGDTIYEAPIGATFTIIGNKQDPTTGATMVIIRFWEWNASKEPKKVAQFNYIDDQQTRRAYFLMNTNDFRLKTMRRFSMRPKFNMGVASMAIKIRNNPFSYESNLNLTSLFGARFRLTPYTNSNYVNLMAGVGVGTVNGMTNADSTSVSVGAVSFKLGGILEFSKVQVGIFVGQDYINQTTNPNVSWQYQGKTWFSVGLGYNVFSSSTNGNVTFPPGQQ